MTRDIGIRSGLTSSCGSFLSGRRAPGPRTAVPHRPQQPASRRGKLRLTCLTCLLHDRPTATRRDGSGSPPVTASGRQLAVSQRGSAAVADNQRLFAVICHRACGRLFLDQQACPTRQSTPRCHGGRHSTRSGCERGGPSDPTSRTRASSTITSTRTLRARE